MRHQWTLLGGLLVGLIVGPLVHADDRALLIGIEKYPYTPLSGPGRDVELAQILAQRMGFTNIRVLRDEEATHQNILAGLQWLVAGVGSAERAFVYYSGHGTQLADDNEEESDGCDEALVPVSENPDELIRDDTFGQPLRRLADRGAQVLAVVDSCFSGTIVKALTLRPPLLKFSTKAADAECNRPVNAKALEVVEETTDAWASKGVVVLTAAAHNEVALADVTHSGKGSLFTQALYDIVNRAGSRSVTYEELRERIEKRIHEVATAHRAEHHAHHPQLEGDPNLFSNRFPLAAAQANEYQEMFEQLLERTHFSVVFRPTKDSLRLGETQTFTVQTPEAGYLHLVEFDSQGNMNLLFPNDFRPGQPD